MMLRFAVAIVLATFSAGSIVAFDWVTRPGIFFPEGCGEANGERVVCPVDKPSLLPGVRLAAEGDLCAPGDILNLDGDPMICDLNHHLVPFLTRSTSDAYTISGRPKYRDDQPELTATKGDIDALNKRLDHLEELIRCQGAAAADDGITAPCP